MLEKIIHYYKPYKLILLLVSDRLMLLGLNGAAVPLYRKADA